MGLRWGWQAHWQGALLCRVSQFPGLPGLVPWLGIEPRAAVVGALRPNHYTTGDPPSHPALTALLNEKE